MNHPPSAELSSLSFVADHWKTVARRYDQHAIAVAKPDSPGLLIRCAHTEYHVLHPDLAHDRVDRDPLEEHLARSDWPLPDPRDIKRCPKGSIDRPLLDKATSERDVRSFPCVSTGEGTLSVDGGRRCNEQHKRDGSKGDEATS